MVRSIEEGSAQTTINNVQLPPAPNKLGLIYGCIENFMTLYDFKETRYECVLVNAANQVSLIVPIHCNNIIQMVHNNIAS